MVTVTAPAVVIVAVIGYLGINTIVNFVGNAIKKGKKDEDEKK